MRKSFLTLLLLPLIFGGAGCNLFGPPPVQMKPVTLEYWRTEDDPESLAELITAYQKTHPNVEIVYKKMPVKDYETVLLTALAEDRGPDLFSIPNVWLHGWQTKLLPLPKETTIPTMVVNQQKQIVAQNKKSATLSMIDLRNTYVELVTKDVVMKAPPAKPGARPEDAIYALPLSLDTLALYYNKELLKNAGIEKPPVTWSELLDQATILTVTDESGAIKQSGVALGLSENVMNFFDILTALMMQNGATMADDYGTPTFHEWPPTGRGNRSYPPAVEALLFYDSFAMEGAPNRSWSADMPDSLDAFVTGRTAFYFGYPIDAKEIKARAPKLDLGLAPLPQVDPDKIFNVARYPVEVVSKKTKHPNEAWDFIQFISQPDKVSSFLFVTKRPTAVRSLIKDQLVNPEIGAFAGQTLTARSWYKGVDYTEAEKAFATMIDTKPTAERPDLNYVVGQAASEVSATMK